MAAAEKHRGAPKGNRNGTATKGKPKGQHLTKKLGLEICKLIEQGVPIGAAARANGVSDNTVFEWRRRGRGEDERAKTALTEWFAGEYDKALAGCHAGLVVELREGARSEPRLLMFMLERRFPDEWGRREIQRHEGVVDYTVRVELAFDATPEPVGEGYARRGGLTSAAPRVEVDLDPMLIDGEATEVT